VSGQVHPAGHAAPAQLLSAQRSEALSAAHKPRLQKPDMHCAPSLQRVPSTFLHSPREKHSIFSSGSPTSSSPCSDWHSPRGSVPRLVGRQEDPPATLVHSSQTRLHCSPSATSWQQKPFPQTAEEQDEEEEQGSPGRLSNWQVPAAKEQ